ncbi:MAG: hypothetical protein HDR72_06910 [Ruminococcaceae bacterium]|nr:hypothetical protein [Oscillospiraceae bacterium]
MGVLKYSSVRYGGSGVDIANTVDIRKPQTMLEELQKQSEEEMTAQEAAPAEPILSAEELLAQREAELLLRERNIEERENELAALKAMYIEQGKEVILEAKRRAEGMVRNAEQQASEIVSDAEQNRDDVFIKARAEGYEQGKKDGVAACLKAGQGILDEAKEYSDRINDEKVELFERYEKEIYETVMEIANKVTLGSMSVKDGTAAKKLIKKAAKEFRNAQLIRITLDENGASTELAGDYEFLKELCPNAEHVEVELLKDAETGTVIVDNGEEITDAGIRTQLKMIKELGDGKFRTSTPRRRKKSAESEETVQTEEDGGEE